MTQTAALPSIEVIPDDMEEQLHYLIHRAPERVTEEWLCNLIKNSSHLTTPEHLRWRVIGLIWLATKFNADKAWPYLMWFNMNEPTMGDHFNEIVADGAEELACQTQLAAWIAETRDERLVVFFRTYKNIPAPYKMGAILRRLVSTADDPATGVWLAGLCRDTAANASPQIRPWRLLIAVWYATCFNPGEGWGYLRDLSNGQVTLSAEDNKLLMEAASNINAAAAMTQWIADCPDPAVRIMLQDFGHPNLDDVVASIFNNPPDYTHLTPGANDAAEAAQLFERVQRLLAEADVSPQSAEILDLACGPLAPQTLLLNSAGYQVTGVDLHIPPAYLPSPNLVHRLFKKRKYVKAWQTATASYYNALGRCVDHLELTWKKAGIELADLTRLHLADHRFDVVICINYLHQAPDVNGLLAEAARVLKPGGLFLADIKPYSALDSDFQPADQRAPRRHLRDGANSFRLNRWSEARYRAGLETHFTLERWLIEQNPAAEAQLTPEIQAELADYSPEELTQRRIMAVARKEQ